MAQLDRFLNLLITNNASVLSLSEGEIATLTIKDLPRPVMKQALTSAQILTLVREISPPNQPHNLDAQGSVRFEYTCADGTFEVLLTQNGKISARIAPSVPGTAKTNPSPVPPVGFTPTAAPIMPTSAVAATPIASPVAAPLSMASAAPAPRGSAVGGRALEKMESLLRVLISNKASDLHLRAGSPPLLRASGDIAPIANEAVLSSDDIEAMVSAVMLEHNREEFKELNDSDFAHEIPGVARFRGNALR